MSCQMLMYREEITHCHSKDGPILVIKKFQKLLKHFGLNHVY